MLGGLMLPGTTSAKAVPTTRLSSAITPSPVDWRMANMDMALAVVGVSVPVAVIAGLELVSLVGLSHNVATPVLKT